MGETIVGLVDGLMSNLVWICIALGAILGFVLGLVIFKDRRRWIWRSLLIAFFVLLMTWATNIAFFYDAYIETKEPHLQEASRMLIGHENPALAKEIEFLIIGAEKEDWKVAGLIKREKDFSDDGGEAVITRHLFSTDIRVETNEAVWTATCLFGRVTAGIEYK